ncbi:MAG: hypothetical protein V1816_14675 [Pseudomonadota bacterium]
MRDLDREQQRAQALLSELENILHNVYEDMIVSRDKVRVLTGQARNLTSDESAWPGGKAARDEFITSVEKLEKKIFQTLDLKRLKEEGLVKAVRF